MRGFATGVGAKADIGALPLTRLSFMSTRPSAQTHSDDARGWPATAKDSKVRDESSDRVSALAGCSVAAGVIL